MRHQELVNAVLLLSAGAVLGAVLGAPVVNQRLAWLARRWRRRRTLILKRPLVTFDLEGTGLLVTKDRIVEIAAVKLMPDGSTIRKGPQRLNPGVPIPEDASAVHGITNADVASAPRFSDVAAEWLAFFEGCDVHGYNAMKYDVPLLKAECRRAGHSWPASGCRVIDSFAVFARNEPRTLKAALRFFCGRDLDGAHGAMADSLATLDVLQAQVAHYSSLPQEVDQLAVYCRTPTNSNHVTWDGKFAWRGNEVIINFGRLQGTTLRSALYEDRDYILWMSAQENFAEDTLELVRNALKGQLPQRPQANAVPSPVEPAEV